MKNHKIFTIFLLILLPINSIANENYTLNGNYTSLSTRTQVPYSNLANNVIIIVSFATWCQPCKSEMNELNKVFTHLEENNIKINILSLSVSPATDSLEKLALFKHEAEIEFDFFAGWEFGIDQDNYFSEYFGIQTIPTTLILDNEGNEVKRWEKLVISSEIINYLDDSVTVNADNEIFNLGAQLVNNSLFRIFLITIVAGAMYNLFIPKMKKNL